LKETPKMRKIYSDIQSKLFYMIPESWSKLYLYASITDQVHGMPIGEMYFYYFPKGILKKRPINVYEIPNKFNIDDEVYSKLINELYSSIKQLREEAISATLKPWSNITISIVNYQFSIEYHYEDLSKSEYSNIERHIIWRYKHIQQDLNTYNKKERKLIEEYLKKKNTEKVETYTEGVYKKLKRNIVGYDAKKYVVTEEAKEEIIKKNQILNVNN